MRFVYRVASKNVRLEQEGSDGRYDRSKGAFCKKIASVELERTIFFRKFVFVFIALGIHCSDKASS